MSKQRKEGDWRRHLMKSKNATSHKRTRNVVYGEEPKSNVNSQSPSPLPLSQQENDSGSPNRPSTISARELYLCRQGFMEEVLNGGLGSGEGEAPNTPKKRARLPILFSHDQGSDDVLTSPVIGSVSLSDAMEEAILELPVTQHVSSEVVDDLLIQAPPLENPAALPNGIVFRPIPQNLSSVKKAIIALFQQQQFYFVGLNDENTQWRLGSSPSRVPLCITRYGKFSHFVWNGYLGREVSPKDSKVVDFVVSDASFSGKTPVKVVTFKKSIFKDQMSCERDLMAKMRQLTPLELIIDVTTTNTSAYEVQLAFQKFIRSTSTSNMTIRILSKEGEEYKLSPVYNRQSINHGVGISRFLPKIPGSPNRRAEKQLGQFHQQFIRHLKNDIKVVNDYIYKLDEEGLEARDYCPNRNAVYGEDCQHILNSLSEDTFKNFKRHLEAVIKHLRNLQDSVNCLTVLDRFERNRLTLLKNITAAVEGRLEFLKQVRFALNEYDKQLIAMTNLFICESQEGCTSEELILNSFSQISDEGDESTDEMIDELREDRSRLRGYISRVIRDCELPVIELAFGGTVSYEAKFEYIAAVKEHLANQIYGQVEVAEDQGDFFSLSM